MLGKRVEGLDVNRGIMIILVVLFHAVDYNKFYDVNSLYYSINYFLNPVRMPSLLLVSGVLAGTLIGNSSKGRIRTANLLWIFLMWLPINLLVHGPTPQNYHQFSKISTEIIAPSTELWFMWVLCVLTTTLLFLKQNHRPYVVVTSFIVSELSFTGILNDGTISHTALFQYAFFFYVGSFFHKELMSLLYRGKTSYFILSLAATLSIHYMNKLMAELLGSGVIGNINAAAMCAAALTGSCLISKVRIIGHGLRWIGSRTLPIYVSHGPLIILISLWRPSTGSRHVDSLIMPLIIVVGVIVVGLTMRRALQRIGAGWMYKMPEAFEDRVAALPFASRT